MRRSEKRGCKANKVGVGILILLAGTILLLRQMGFLLEPTYQWLFTWPMILVVVGIFIGFATKFRDLSWLVLIGIGFFFLIDDIVPGISIRQYIWPAIVIGLGLIVIFWPRKKSTLVWERRIGFDSPKHDYDHDPETSDFTKKDSFENVTQSAELNKDAEEEKNVSFEEVLDVTAIFGGIKKNVVSKVFKGGDIVSIFGGCEINLSQADFDKQVKIDAVQIFGGCTLIIPPNWQVRSESVTIFGGIDDKRERMSDKPDKVLILEGFTLFGGIELKSY